LFLYVGMRRDTPGRSAGTCVTAKLPIIVVQGS
jgi:hypothetical protein